ncbi:MAG TPA: hypothetical protein VEB20_00990 [Azospirillaceae bacterium]|nr:hypothetical protein [Azospirillaceae bacterium]
MKATISRLLPAALLLALAAPIPALAQADARAAARLDALLEERLRELARPLPGGIRLERAVDARVEPAGDRFRVTLPELRVVLPEGQLLELGTLALEAAPTPNGGYAFTGALPGTIPVFNREGFREGEVRIARQNFRGSWTGDLKTMDGLDLGLGGVVFTPREGKGTIRLEALTAKAQPEDYRNSRWTGPATLTVSGLDVRGRDGSEQMALGRGQLRLRIDRLDVAKLAAWNQAAARLAAADDGKEALSPAEQAALRQGLPHLEGLAGALGMQGEVQGLASRAGDGTMRRVESARWTLSLDGLDRPRSALSLDYQHSGLALTGPQVRRDVAPRTGSLVLKASGVPAAELLAAYRERVADTATVGDREAGRRFEAVALETLGRAGTSLTLDRLAFDGAEAAAQGAGALRFSLEAARGLTGGLDFTLRGFQALVQQAQAGNAKAAGTVVGLYALEGLGQPGTDAQGRPQRRYKVEVAEDGRILLNGSDVTSLVSGLLSLR